MRLIPTGNVLTGCYTKSGGALRVIDATVTTCKASETRLDWNVQGPKGDTMGDSKGRQGRQGRWVT